MQQYLRAFSARRGLLQDRDVPVQVLTTHHVAARRSRQAQPLGPRGDAPIAADRHYQLGQLE
jgi:hypothetical protein